MGCNARLLSNRLDGVVPRFPLRRRKRKEPENGDLTGRPRPFDHLATAKMSTKSFHCLSSTGCVGRFSFRRAFFFTPLRRFIFFCARVSAKLSGTPRWLPSCWAVSFRGSSKRPLPLENISEILSWNSLSLFLPFFFSFFFVSNRADGCPSCFGR